MISKWGVVICIFLMLSLTISNIMLRWFELSILWIEPLVRHIVFVAAFLGGSLATGEGHHIKIDLLGRILETSKKTHLFDTLNRIVGVVSLIATLTITYASFNLAKLEFAFGKEAFLGIHSGYLLSIIPLGMGFISLRVLVQIFLEGDK